MSSEKPPRSLPPLLEPASRAELRAWLAENHDTSPGVRIAIGKKGTTVTSLTYEEAVEEAVAFGWIDSTTRTLDDDRYAVLFTPRRRGSIWAQSNKRRVERLTAAGLMEPSGLAAVADAQEDGSWDLLTDVENLVVPEDLAVAFSATPGSEEGFNALSASLRRQILYWIASAKREQTRADRIRETVLAAADGRAPR